MKEKFDVTGMTCSACSSRVEKCVSKLEGIENVSVNLLTNSMQVEYDEGVLKENQIIDAVVKAGYGASPAQQKQGTENTSLSAQKERTNPAEAELKNMKMRLIVSFIFLIPLMYGRSCPSFLPGRIGKCRELRFYPASFESAYYLCKP